MAKVEEERIETEEYACPYCQKPVKTFWSYSTTKTSMCLGINTHPSYILAGDVIFHTECWDKLIEEHPPEGVNGSSSV